MYALSANAKTTNTTVFTVTISEAMNRKTQEREFVHCVCVCVKEKKCLRIYIFDNVCQMHYPSIGWQIDSKRKSRYNTQFKKEKQNKHQQQPKSMRQWTC